MKIFLPLFLILGIFVLMITSCSSSEKSSDDKMKIEEAPPPLSPGTASVEAEIVSITKMEDGTKCKLKILKVFEYGSSTPVLAENVEMETTLSKTLSEQNDIESGKTFKLLLRSREMKGEEAHNWQISKIYK